MTCKTCRWWQLPTGSEHWGSEDIATPMKYPDCEPLPVEFEVRYCVHPKLEFCERPLESNGFAIADGSTYMANLFTAENFGCLRHSSIDTKDYPEC